MIVVFGVVLLVLAAAIVVLFAMLGELTARLPHLQIGYRDPFMRPLEEARIGARPDSWPEPLAPLAEMDDAVIMALSTACATCANVAVQLSEGFTGALEQAAVVISTGNRRAGEDFVRRHRLDRMRCYVDESGGWLTGSFGVKTSPTALVMKQGALSSAFVFGDVANLARELSRPQAEMQPA